MLNSGYRFRFSEKVIPGEHREFDKFIRQGLFVNAGIYVGAERNEYVWHNTDDENPDHTEHEGTEIKPFGMLEVAVGIEF